MLASSAAPVIRSAQTTDPQRRLSALWLRLAWILSLALTAVRLDLSQRVGFGDAEALYATYALHPQPAYLDHPGLIGAIFRLTAGADVPDPRVTHLVTSLAATALPWFGFAAARICGASTPRALWCFFGLALMPLLLIGTFAMTPDLPLAYAWIGALACAVFSVSRPADSWSALLAATLCGVCVGFAAWSKASGALLGVGLLTASFSPALRRRWLTLGPWSALLVSSILVSPIIAWEVDHGWPMLIHRLLATQSEAGLSLRNLGAFLGGQLLYITPPFLLLAWVTLREAWKARSSTDSFLVLGSVLVPGVILAGLCLWSRVAEPHWFAPTYLGLVFYMPFLPNPEIVSPRWRVACMGVGLTSAILGYALVRSPWLTQFMAWQSQRFGKAFEPRYDLSNDLYAWQPAQPMLEQTLTQVARETGEMPVLFGPHWTVCAQVSVVLPKGVPVGCLSQHGDDFFTWNPPEQWLGQSPLIYVTDDRFDLGLRYDSAADSERDVPLPGYRARLHRRVAVQRGGHTVRIIRASWLERDSGTARDQRAE